MNIDRQVDVSGYCQGLESSLRGLSDLGITAGRWNAPYPLVNDRNAGGPINHALYTTLRFTLHPFFLPSSRKIPKLSERAIPS